MTELEDLRARLAESYREREDLLVRVQRLQRDNDTLAEANNAIRRENGVAHVRADRAERALVKVAIVLTEAQS